MKLKKNYAQSKATYAQSKKHSSQDTVRVFSDEMKRKKVQEIEQGLIGVSALARSLELSRSAIYKWIRKYSLTYTKKERMIVESKSESMKVLILQERIKELERMLGQKQIQLEFSDKMLEMASEELGIDLKKKFDTRPSSGIGIIKSKYPTK